MEKKIDRESRKEHDHSPPLQWISVKESHPHHDQPVLVYQEGASYYPILLACFVVNGPNETEQFWYAYEAPDKGELHVTHWMPLPEPPE